MNTLKEIKDEKVKAAIIARCGEAPDKQGLVCPVCGAHEVYANREQPDNCDLWFWMIRAFRVDDASECKNCGQWFVC